jgi:hypothetical protein
MPSFRARNGFALMGIKEENLVTRDQITITLTEAQQSVIFKALYEISRMTEKAPQVKCVEMLRVKHEI